MKIEVFFSGKINDEILYIMVEEPPFTVDLNYTNKAIFVFSKIHKFEKEKYDKALKIYKIFKRIKQFNEKFIDRILRKGSTTKLLMVGLEREKDFNLPHNFIPISFPLKEDNFTIDYITKRDKILLSMSVYVYDDYLNYTKTFSLSGELLDSSVEIRLNDLSKEDYFYIIKRMEIFLRLYSKALFQIALKIKESDYTIKYENNNIYFSPYSNDILKEIVFNSRLNKNVYIKRRLWEKWTKND